MELCNGKTYYTQRKFGQWKNDNCERITTQIWREHYAYFTRCNQKRNAQSEGWTKYTRIMYANWYKPLFEYAIQLSDTKVYAYYFNIPFEETLKRHLTKPNCNDFGEETMRRWWREKDFSDVLNEVCITAERDIENIVSDIYSVVMNN